MGKGISMLFEYETQKIVQINSTKVGVINRIIQIFIVGYIICYVMIYEKGYQGTDTLVSAVTTKVKGIGFVNISDKPVYGLRSWDTADYVEPPQENNAFFVTTNAVITPKQSPGICREDKDVRDSYCKNNSDCVVGRTSILGHGANTGRCLNYTTEHGICEIYAWCPLEVDEYPIRGEPLFPMVYNYTVLIKNDIEFPKFGVKRRNVLNWAGKKFLYNCQFNASHPEHRFCPIITLGTIFDDIKSNKKLLIKGGVVSINIDWTCNLDWDMKYCNPTYTFRRLDNENSKIAKGLNFRYARYYRNNDTEYRDLVKAYGVRFLVFVNGKAGKFSVIPLTMNLGSGMALLGLAAVLCDVIVLHILGSKELYRTAKFQTVEKDGKEDEQDEISNDLMNSKSKNTILEERM